METHGEIEKLHARTAHSFMQVLEGDCEIEPPPAFRANWHRRELEERVCFFLWSKPQHQFGVRAAGGTRCPIVSAKVANPAWDNGESTWVAWREIWTRAAQNSFLLEEAAFTFFWGRPSVEAISHQLFRAEWPQKPAGGSTSAQPHWQVDWPLADLEHVVSGIHFGMAGWECEHPGDDTEVHLSRYWRRFAKDEIAETLEKWAVRTLEYSLDQIVNFYPKDLV